MLHEMMFYSLNYYICIMLVDVTEGNSSPFFGLNHIDSDSFSSLHNYLLLIFSSEFSACFNIYPAYPKFSNTICPFLPNSFPVLLLNTSWQFYAAKYSCLCGSPLEHGLLTKQYILREYWLSFSQQMLIANNPSSTVGSLSLTTYSVLSLFWNWTGFVYAVDIIVSCVELPATSRRQCSI